ncbi:MAG: hypothetical protein NTW29_16210 [Bacteroidetes bacterium]|nr:hypothetical protein [Bacteroidota bacterium]
MNITQIDVVSTMYLSYERAVVNTTGCCSNYYFGNTGNRYPGKQSFSSLYRASEEQLDAGTVTEFIASENTLLVLLPVNGAIVVKDHQPEEDSIAAGQLYFIPMKNGERVQVKNPFLNGAVNYLQLCFYTGQAAPAQKATASFDVNKYPACMMRISPAHIESYLLPFMVSIGKFAGRQDTMYYFANPSNGAWACVLAGAFEVQGRLLQEGDALTLFGEPMIEMEALSNDALLFLIELPFTISCI